MLHFHQALYLIIQGRQIKTDMTSKIKMGLIM